jgi:hypothetical protein
MGDPRTVKVRRRGPECPLPVTRLSLVPDTAVLGKVRRGSETLALTLLFATAER